MTRSPKRPVKRPSSRGSASSRQRTRPGNGRGRSGSANAPVSGPRTGTFTTRAVILLSIVLLLFASYTSSLHAWWQQRGEIQSKRAEIAMREDAIDTLKDDRERWRDSAFVEQQARERFGWVLPGEVGYRVIGADGKVQGDVSTLNEPAQPEAKQWHDLLWGSVVEAGKSPKKETPQPDPDVVIKPKKKQ